VAAARFHCTAAIHRAVKKSKHRVGAACTNVCRVLALRADYGLVVKGHAPLRKMRVAAPGLTAGKSGGYRLIYATSRVDECQHFVLLALYYKGDREDLDASDYRALQVDAAAVLGNVIDYAWDAGVDP
jgi:hypothetical protein